MNSVDNKPVVPFPNPGSDGQLVRTSDLMRSTIFPGPGPGGQAGTAGNGGAPSMSVLLQALRRRWPTAISAGIVAGAIGIALAVLLFPAPYTSSGVVQIVTKVARPIIKGEGGDMEDPNIFKMTMAARIKSPMVLLAALKDLDVGGLRGNPNAIKWLETALKVDFLLGPEILRVTLSADDPQEVAALLNRVMDAFIAESRRDEEDRWKKTMDSLEASRAKAESDLRQRKTQLATAEKDAKLPDQKTSDELFRGANEQVNALKKEALLADLEVVQYTEELRSLKEKETKLPDLPISPFFMQRELEKTREGKEILDRKAGIELQMSQVVNKTPYIALLKQIDNEIDKLIEGKGPQIRKILIAEALEQVRFQKSSLEDKINGATKKKERLDGELRLAQAEARDYNPQYRKSHPAIEALRDEVARTEAVVTELGKTIAVLRVEPKPEPRVKEWSRAEVPSGKDHSRQLKFGGAGGFAFFMIAMLGVCYFELRVGRISNADDVHGGLGMPVVGTLPPAPARARSLTENADASAWQGRLIEAVDSVRTYLTHTGRMDNVHVIMVTSAGMGEGKTSLASQLAASLARSWRKTLLIDGDLRHPATHTLFNVPLEPGFAEVLRGEASPAEAIKPTALSRLWLMPAGHCDAHAVQALSQDSVRTMFESLKQQFDFIIVDSCPVLPVADSLSLGQHVDGVLYAVLRDVSRVPALKAAHTKLSNLNIRSLGAVLIGCNSDVSSPGSRYAMLEGSLK